MSGERTSDILQEPLDRLLRAHADMPLLRAAERGTRPEGLEQALAGLGLETALVPEAQGGAGLAWADLAGVFEALGYHAAPVPLGERILAHWALAHLGLPSPDAACTALALDPLTLAADGTASGTAQVPWGQGATQVLAELHGGGPARLALIDAAGAQTAPLQTVGRDPAVRIRFTGAPVLASVPAGPVGLMDALAVLRAGQISGALSRILELCIDYGNTRVQFGKPIGKFQAVQHLIAGLAGEAAGAKAGVELALASFDAGGGWEGAAVAKIRASGAVSRSTFAAHETHGAIGVTEEHVLHYFTRRLWQWRDEGGNENHWSERLGRAALAPDSGGVWPLVVRLSRG